MYVYSLVMIFDVTSIAGAFLNFDQSHVQSDNILLYSPSIVNKVSDSRPDPRNN